MRQQILKCLAFVIVMSGAVGCATPSLPTATSLQAVPVYDYGERPTGDDYIMRFRRGTEVPVILSFEGNVIEGKEMVTRVTLSKDVYIYKHWMSYDNVNWQHGYLKFDPSVAVDYPNPDGLVVYSILVTMPQ